MLSFASWVPPVWSSPLSANMSSSDSVKPKMSAFSAIR